MRDPNRIDPFMAELGRLWKKNCPDWRFGQLMFNAMRVMQTHGTDIFYMEEDQLLEYFREWFDYNEEKEKLEKELIGHMIDKHEMAKHKRREVCMYPERRKQVIKKEEK